MGLDVLVALGAHMTPDARTWMNLGRELSIREIAALDEENQRSSWARVDVIRDRALAATNAQHRERWLKATEHVSSELVVMPR